MRAKALASLLLILAVGCGDDEGGSDGGAGAGAGSGGSGASGGGGAGGSGGRPMLPGVGGSSGADAGPGMMEEGGPCLTVADCAEVDGTQLACVEVGFNFGVCARPCVSNAECGSEVCVSFSGQSADAHCINLVTEEFAFCGVAETSDCADELGLTCLYLPDLPIGVCTKLCASSEDGGVPDPVCTEDQFCRGGIVMSSGGEIDGVCGVHAARGETCGIVMNGAFCDEEDVCSPNDPDDEESPFTCHQRCNAQTPCETGTCTQYQGVFFCL